MDAVPEAFYESQIDWLPWLSVAAAITVTALANFLHSVRRF